MNQDRAIYQIRIWPEGKGKRALDVASRVMSVEFVDYTAKADKLTLSVDNSDLRNFDDPVWRKGAVLEISLGYQGLMTDTRRCVIKSVKGGQRLAVEANALSVVMNRTKRCRVWKNMTLQQMADKVSFEYQSILQYEEAVKKDTSLQTLGDNLQIIHAVQAAETDAQFLHRQAKKFGLIFSVGKDGKVAFSEPHMQAKPKRTLVWRGGAGDWIDFDIENDITRVLGAVTHKGIDTKTKTEVEHRADNAATKREGLMQTVEVVDPRTGKTSYQERAASESVEHTTTGEAGNAHVQAKAEGKFKASQRSTIKLTGIIVGDPRVVAGSILVIEGLGKRVSGKYRVTESKHVISDEGAYKTVFKAHGDGHGGYNEGNNTPSKADQNKQKAADEHGAASELELEQREVVDKRTGRTHFEYHRRGT